MISRSARPAASAGAARSRIARLHPLAPEALPGGRFASALKICIAASKSPGAITSFWGICSKREQAKGEVPSSVACPETSGAVLVCYPGLPPGRAGARREKWCGAAEASRAGGRARHRRGCASGRRNAGGRPGCPHNLPAGTVGCVALESTLGETSSGSRGLLNA